MVLIINKKMAQKHSSKAISTVLTTMIILVASIVLAVGVVIYGTSLFQTGALQEVIEIKGVRAWVNGTNSSGVTWTAAAVRNSGDKLVSVDHIVVRGTTVPFSNWYVDINQAEVSIENYQAQFNHTSNDSSGMLKDSEDSGVTPTSQCTGDTTNDATTIEIDLDGQGVKPTLCLLQANAPISLQPGQRLIVYFRLPEGIVVPIDSGTATNIGIFAGKTGAPITTIIRNP